MSIAEQVLAVAESALDTPFKHQGRIAGLALDCAGLFVHICQTLDLPHSDAKGYPRNPYDGQLEKQLGEQACLREIPVSEAATGDVLAMRISTAPQHIAIHAGYIDGHPYVIHASEESGKTCKHRMDSLWQARVMRVYRFEVAQ